MAVGAATEDLYATLKSTFGYTSFRPLQEEIVTSILDGRDVFVLMPTGGGKSLCYQLPALLMTGVTVVVSPLIALMKDQVDALQALGVAATFINSSLAPREIEARQAKLARGEVDLVYVAPERLMMPHFLRLLAEIDLSFIAIDEAHCISEWGHDFRPEYRDLKELRRLFPRVPVGAFTATATPRVRADIQSQLGMGEAERFVGSFNRANLYYEVRPKRNTYDQLLAYLRAHPNASGIIYCLSRKSTDSLAADLRADGFQAASYHAGLEAEERRVRQEAFVRDDVPIIVATIAFGMGIDKPDVRFVIHYDLPKTLENYYQESGRAGRDGEPSDCILFYSAGDAAKLQGFISDKPLDERKVAVWQLRRMMDWAEATSCRRVSLLQYFDEIFTGQDAPCCDNCRAGYAEEDITVPAQMFLSCVMRLRERFGASQVIDVLRGSRSQKVLQNGHDGLSTYGIGTGRSADDWRAIARELIRAGYLTQEPEEHNVLKVTGSGRGVLFGGERVSMVVVQRTEPVRTDTAVAHPDLFERLRGLRKRLADLRSLPPYVIFHDSALRQMSARLPADEAKLMQLSGIGSRKVADYGQEFLEEIARYVEETGASPVLDDESAGMRPQRRRRAGLNETARATLELFRDGHGIAEIAHQRGFKGSTIERHLVECLEAGEELEVDRLVAPEKRPRIEAAFERVGMMQLGPVLEELGEGYTYGELHIVRALLRRAGAPPADDGEGTERTAKQSEGTR